MTPSVARSAGSSEDTDAGIYRATSNVCCSWPAYLLRFSHVDRVGVRQEYVFSRDFVRTRRSVRPACRARLQCPPATRRPSQHGTRSSIGTITFPLVNPTASSALSLRNPALPLRTPLSAGGGETVLRADRRHARGTPRWARRPCRRPPARRNGSATPDRRRQRPGLNITRAVDGTIIWAHAAGRRRRQWRADRKGQRAPVVLRHQDLEVESLVAVAKLQC